MSCSVAVANSPVFSPSRIPRSSCCKTSSPETLTLIHQSDGSPSSTSPFRSSSRFSRALSSPSASPSTTSAASVLKRKRPARIDIPPMTDGLSFAPAPAVVGSDGRSEVEMDGARCSVYCKRGRKRLQMEDRYNADLDVDGDPQFAFFGIFDGHGGAKAADFASENMGKHVIDELRKSGEGKTNVEEAVRNAYRETDSKFLKEELGGGTCCVTAFVNKGSLVVSNVGDCRAVLSISGAAEALTSDHKPSREDEKERIESLGGYVDYCRGVWRLQGCLAVSRAIGDSHLKQWVIPDPETRSLVIKPEFEFLVLASDGLWDKVSNQEAVDIARPFCVDPHNPSPLNACRKLAELSASRGSADDISVMIIQLNHFMRREAIANDN